MTATTSPAHGGHDMYIPDMTILLIVCYVFGILTAAVLYLMIESPHRRAREKRAYMAGYMDGFTYGSGGDDIDY